MCLIPKTPPSIPSFIIFVFAQGSCSHPFFWRYGSISSYYLQPSIRRMGCLPIIKEHLQTCILSRFSVFQESDCNKKIEFPTIISPWLQVCIYWNAVCYLMAWIFIIIFTMIFIETQSVVYNDIHWNTVCLTTSIVDIHFYYDISWNTVCYLTISVVDIHIYCDTFIISQEQWKWFSLSSVLCLFCKTAFAAIHQIKQTMFG